MENKLPKVLLCSSSEAWLYLPNRKPIKLVSSDRHVMLLVDIVLAPPGFPTLSAYLNRLAIADQVTEPCYDLSNKVA